MDLFLGANPQLLFSARAREWNATAMATGMKVTLLKTNLTGKVFMLGLTVRSTRENGKLD
jgi:hypothetical protein